jgi:hypothetical protein
MSVQVPKRLSPSSQLRTADEQYGEQKVMKV